MKKLLTALVALAALGFYTNTTTTLANAPAANQPQVEVAAERPGGNWFDDTVGGQWWV